MQKVFDKELDTVQFNEKRNVLSFWYGEDNDDDEFVYEIPCNVQLAAYILKGNVFAKYLHNLSNDYFIKNGFPNIHPELFTETQLKIIPCL